MEIKYYKQLNGSPALALAVEAENALHQAGFTSGHVLVAWNQQALAAFVDGRVVGVLTYEDLEWKNELFVVVGYVHPAFRRRGIYRALWEALVARAQETGRPRIVGTTSVMNQAMQATMEALGRRPVAISYEYELSDA